MRFSRSDQTPAGSEHIEATILVNGDGAGVGTRLSSHPQVAMVSLAIRGWSRAPA